MNFDWLVSLVECPNNFSNFKVILIYRILCIIIRNEQCTSIYRPLSYPFRSLYISLAYLETNLADRGPAKAYIATSRLPKHNNYQVLTPTCVSICSTVWFLRFAFMDAVIIVCFCKICAKVKNIENKKSYWRYKNNKDILRMKAGRVGTLGCLLH